MKKLFILLPLISLILVGASCDFLIEPNKSEDSADLANPASVYCEEQGGMLELRDGNEGQYGTCVFSDGSECEEWAYFRGECLPAHASRRQAGPSDENLVENEIDKAMEKSRETAEAWVEKNSPTYTFDGFDLRYLESKELSCPDCYEHIFFFKSKQAGFGDRAGQILAQVITPHQIAVQVEGGKITSAIIDSSFNEISGETYKSSEAVKQLKVSLVPKNDSGQAGSALLKEELGKLKIIINTSNYPSGVQPVHIHSGSCLNLDKALYPLNSLEGGKSETLLNISLGELEGQLPLAINIHKDVSASAACGDIIGY